MDAVLDVVEYGWNMGCDGWYRVPWTVPACFIARHLRDDVAERLVVVGWTV